MSQIQGLQVIFPFITDLTFGDLEVGESPLDNSFNETQNNTSSSSLMSKGEDEQDGAVNSYASGNPQNSTFSSTPTSEEGDE